MDIMICILLGMIGGATWYLMKGQFIALGRNLFKKNKKE